MKHLLLIILGCLLSPAILADSIQLAENLEHDARASRNDDRPIVFFVTADHCPYCEKLRQEYFRFSPGDERFILRELELDQHHDAVDFDGTQTDHRKLARRYNISLTPTVAFVGPDGALLSKPIIGVLTMDYYHYYFEQALSASMNKLKSQQIARNQ